MSDDNAPATAETVVPFAPRPPLALVGCELRLRAGGFEMSVFDEAGNVAAVLPCGFLSVPEGFDIERLYRAWPKWAEASSIAC